MNFFLSIILESWRLLAEASVYVLFGLLVAGLMRVFINPGRVAHHLGHGRFKSVFKAALLGIPIPLCSCGVLPAAASLRKQGANKGATTAFLISTPESGVDSIALTYALLDPVMTVARPAAAFAAASVAGLAENSINRKEMENPVTPDISCPVDSCCDGLDCPPEVHSSHHRFSEKLKVGITYAFKELWNDIAVWFLVGLLLAGLVTTIIPTEVLGHYLGGGLPSMLIMLVAGVPLYICATASTPIAAALILKGISPGAALVFLLAGPATNITSLTVLYGILGKKTTAIYLATIAVMAVIAGLVLDQVYVSLGISAQAVAGQAAELVPHWAQIAGALVLLALSVKPVYRAVRSRIPIGKTHFKTEPCGCSSESCSNEGNIIRNPSALAHQGHKHS
jgi:uncharacterized membrane protein YraQ (UPF0718 family)